MSTPEELTSTSIKGDEFAALGFTHNFALLADAVLDVDTHTSYTPETVRIVREHRAEGNTDPADESMLLAIETPDGIRGTLTVAYGPSNEHAETLRRLGTDHPNPEI